jgi:molecular chaperone Hsp33
LLQAVKLQGVAESAKQNFTTDEMVFEERKAAYKCNCSRRYLTRVLVSLGEAQMRQIIEEDGAVRVHCHYCNTDYEFTNEDADLLFPKE